MQSSINHLAEVVIFGGSGQFGRLFSRRLTESGSVVHGVDLADNDHSITFRGDEANVVRLVKSASAVVLCIPEKDILAEIPFLSRHMSSESLLVDIASVKSKVTSVAEYSLKNTGIEYLSIHPMFGPSINFAGGNMVFIEPIGTSRANHFKKLVESWNVVSHTMTASEHDEAARISQVACHAAVIAYASVAAMSGLDLDVIRKVETPVSRALLSLGSRILAGDPSLYYGVQCNNGTLAREALVRQLNDIEEYISNKDEDRWNAKLKKSKEFFGTHLDSYARLANEMLKTCRT